MEKKFKPFDKVIIREDKDSKWICDFYSHNDNWTKECWCLGIRKWIGIDNILPYEGNEHLVGTTDESYEEVRLEEGEWVMVCDKKSILPEEWRMRRYDGIDSSIRAFNNSSASLCAWKYTIRFSDFNPNDMEETKKHILCVKNGKVIRYKG